MFLHLGQDVMIPARSIIAIIDYQAMESESTREFLNVALEEGFVHPLTDDPNSFVVTNDKVYLSPISALTLKKRVNEFGKFSKE